MWTKAHEAKKPIVPRLGVSEDSRGERGNGDSRILTSKNEKQKANQRTIPHIQNTTHQTAQTQFRHPISHRVQEDIERACASCQKGAPLPMVVLGTQQVVDEEHGHGGGGDDHESVTEEEEAEHVVDFAEPDAAHDEVELDEDGAEG